MRAWVFLATVSLAAAAAPDRSHAQALTGDAIKALFFSGKPFVATSPTRQRFTMVFTPDGKAKRTPLAKPGEKEAETVDGTWKTVKEGFCTSWKGGTTNCYRLVPNTSVDNRWSVMKGATTVASWAKPAD